MSNIKNIMGIDYDLDDIDDQIKIEKLKRHFPAEFAKPDCSPRRRYRVKYSLLGSDNEIEESSTEYEYRTKGYL